MLYLDRVETDWPLRVQLADWFSHVPLHCTASGKMYLSTLNDAHLQLYLDAATLDRRTDATITDPGKLMDEIHLTRERQYSEDAEEFMDGMVAIAVPILDDQGRLVSTVSFHAPSIRLTLAEARVHVPRLRSASEALSRLLLD